MYTWLRCKIPYFRNRLNLTFLRSVQNNCGRTHNTKSATKNPENVQFLPQYYPCKSSTVRQYSSQQLKSVKIKTNSHTRLSSYLIIILSAPRGVTRIAGANAYAAKLAISPTITATMTLPNQDAYCNQTFALQISKASCRLHNDQKCLYVYSKKKKE